MSATGIAARPSPLLRDALVTIVTRFGLAVLIFSTDIALARLLLGSTSARLLKETDRPVLLVPPGDLEVVSLSSDRVALHFGAVIAAVDQIVATAMSGDQRVVAAKAIDQIVVRAADQGVVTGIAEDDERAGKGAAIDFVIAGATVQHRID